MTFQSHPTAEVSLGASIGDGTSIWHHAQVREGASIGKNCILGKGVYIDSGVNIGSNVKIQNYVSVYQGATIEDGVFIGPHVCFTNDLRPRAVNPDGSLKSAEDWAISKTLIRKGAALGANATILCGITIGVWAIAGAGSVVTHDVPDHGLVRGNPALLSGFVCRCGADLKKTAAEEHMILASCSSCGWDISISRAAWEALR